MAADIAACRLFFFGKLLKLIAQNAWQSIAPIAAFVIAYEGEIVTKIVLGIVAEKLAPAE